MRLPEAVFKMNTQIYNKKRDLLVPFPDFPLLSLQEHRTEIDARAGTFQAFEQFGQQLLARGHYASPEIQQKLEALDSERAGLEKAWVQRRMMLDQCLELQVPVPNTPHQYSAYIH